MFVPASLILLLIFCPALATAQDYLYRFEVHGAAGFASVTGDEGSLGGGLAGGGGLAWRFTRKWALEADLSAFRHRRAPAPGLVFQGHGAYLTGNLVRHFSTGRAQPYVVFGGGLLRYTNKSLQEQFPELPVVTDSRPALNAGFGVKTFLSRRLSLRPEIRLYAGGAGTRRGVEPPVTNLRLSVGVGYHW